MCFRSEASYIANMFYTKFSKSIKAMLRNVSGEQAGIYDTAPESQLTGAVRTGMATEAA